ncbi:MAG: hypothetical protein HY255_00960 [Betaproteobacteria bacterium]|nr:hypothetical protein [Betaproteobacteria bacterium]
MPATPEYRTLAGQSGLPRGVVYAWLTAGTLDICAAMLTSTLRGGSATGVLRAVASGVLGKAAIGGGDGVAALGLFLHFFIMLAIATIFWLAAQRMAWLTQKPWLAGPLYGVAVYAVMNAVVLPLSAIAFTPLYTPTTLSIGIGVHMVCVGLPIALITTRFTVRNKQ